MQKQKTHKHSIYSVDLLNTQYIPRSVVGSEPVSEKSTQYKEANY